MTTDQKIEALTSKYQALSDRMDAIFADQPNTKMKKSPLSKAASEMAKKSRINPTEAQKAASVKNGKLGASHGAKGGRPKKSPPSDS